MFLVVTLATGQLEPRPLTTGIQVILGVVTYGVLTVVLRANPITEFSSIIRLGRRSQERAV